MYIFLINDESAESADWAVGSICAKCYLQGQN